MAENKGRVLNAVRRTVQAVLSLILALLTALVVYIMVCNMQGKAAEVFGTSVLKVLTGSMEPSIHSGDYIIVSSDYIRLNVGDVICFYSKDPAIYGMPNTHRIVRINDDGSYVTKGDANNAEDPVAVTSDDIIGKYVGKVRFLRWINSFASVKKLIFASVVIIMSAIAIYEVRTIAKVTKECKQKESPEDAVRRATRKSAGFMSRDIPPREKEGRAQMNQEKIMKAKMVTAIVIAILSLNVKNDIYANYKVMLTAELLDANNDPIANTDCFDYIIYTNAKICTEMVA